MKAIDNLFKIANTINNTAKAFEDHTHNLKKKIEELAFLNKIERVIFLTSDLTLLSNLVLHIALRILKAKSGLLILINSDSHELQINSIIGYDSEEIKVKKTISTKNTIPGWVIKKKEPVLVYNIDTDIRFQNIERLEYEKGSFVYIPLIVKNEIIGLLWFGNKISNNVFSVNELISLNVLSNEAASAIKHIQLYTESEKSYLSIIQGLALAIDARDPHTHGHSTQVAHFAKLISIELGLSQNKIDDIYNASLLHDLGKVGISDEILKKKANLSEEEDRLIKMHPVIAKQILSPIKSLEDIIPYIYHHHEWYNGTGYPDGLSGEKIPLGARIIAVADSFSAMISRRPRFHHNKTLSSKEALMELKKGKSMQFDPKIVKTFEQIVKEDKI
ncbi:MAG: HD domain-containing phosphohydrolase [bacterium]|nr:HD domain-containing phosphohydrolase [bacterium]